MSRLATLLITLIVAWSSAASAGTVIWPGNQDGANWHAFHVGAPSTSPDPPTSPELHGGHAAASFLGSTTGLLADIVCSGSNYLPIWTGSAWACSSWTAIVTSAPPTGAAGGALTGTYPNPGVNLGAGVSVTGALPLANQAAPTGTGFEHVTGGTRDSAARAVNISTPDVTGALPLTSIAQGGAVATNVLTWDGSHWVPAAASATGVTSVSGVPGQIVVATGTTTPVVGLAFVGPPQIFGGTGIASVEVDSYGRLLNAIPGSFLTATSTIAMNGQVDGVGPPGAIVTVIDQMGATTGQVLSWNGTRWAPAATAAGGVSSLAVTDPVTISASTGAVTVGSKFDNSTITLNGGGAEQRGHISGGGLDVPAGSNTATLTGVAFAQLANATAHSLLGDPTGSSASVTPISYGSASGMLGVVVGAPDVFQVYAAGTQNIPFGGANGQLTDSTNLQYDGTHLVITKPVGSGASMLRMVNPTAAVNAFAAFQLATDGGLNAGGFIYFTSSVYNTPDCPPSSLCFSTGTNDTIGFSPNNVNGLNVTTTAVNLPLATPNTIQKADGSKNLVAASSSDITGAVTWPTGAIEGQAGSLTAFATTSGQVLFGATSGGGLTSSSSLTYLAGALSIATSDVSQNAAIELTQSGAQGINKFGGDFFLGTSDSHAIVFYANGANALALRSNGKTAFGPGVVYFGAANPNTTTFGNSSVEFGVTPTSVATTGTVQGMIEFDPQTQVLTGTGTVPSWGMVHVQASTLTDVSAGVVSLAASMILDGPPNCTGSLACTERDTLWVKSGETRIDGSTVLTSLVTGSTQLLKIGPGGVVGDASPSDVAAALGFPAATDVLVSTGPTTAPTGGSGLTFASGNLVVGNSVKFGGLLASSVLFTDGSGFASTDSTFAFNPSTHAMTTSILHVASTTTIGGDLTTSGAVTFSGYAGSGGPLRVNASGLLQVGASFYASATIDYTTQLVASGPGTPAGWLGVASLIPGMGQLGQVYEYPKQFAANTATLKVVVVHNGWDGTGDESINITRNGSIIGATIHITPSTTPGTVLTVGPVAVSGGATTDTYGVEWNGTGSVTNGKEIDATSTLVLQ